MPHNLPLQVLLALGLTSGGSAPAQTPRETLALGEVERSVVLIEVRTPDGSVASGTGFVVREDGIVVTAQHVVAGATQASITTRGGDIFDRVRLLAEDARRDIAILKIPAFGLPRLLLGDSNEASVGDRLTVMGHPSPGAKTLLWSLTDGLLSAKRAQDGFTAFQLSTPVTQGSSGSPVLNSSGNVVAMIISGYDGYEYNFGVPSNYVRGILSEIESLSPDKLMELSTDLNRSTPSPQEATPPAASLAAIPLRDVQKVVVLPMTLDGHLDSALTGAFEEKFTEALPRFSLVDHVEVTMNLPGSNLSDAALSEVIRAARMAGAQAVILGIGSLYRGSAGNPAVRLDVKVIEVNRGTVLWSGGESSRGMAGSVERARVVAAKRVVKAFTDH